jgi:transcriptional regulator with XRE-family HTH domain
MKTYNLVVEPADLIRAGQARRLAKVREESGRDMRELAAVLGISFEAYRDLEDFDEEVVDCISFEQLTQLAAAIGLDLRAFFEADGLGHLTFAELAARLESETGGNTGTLAALEERVGWEFGRHLDRPETFGELPAIALADIGAAVGVDWRTLLPETRLPPVGAELS